MELQSLRNEINEIDREIVKLYEKRLEAVHEVGKYKKENNLEVKNSAVEEKKLKDLSGCASEENAEEIVKLFKFIFDESCNIQEDILNNQFINAMFDNKKNRFIDI